MKMRGENGERNSAQIFALYTTNIVSLNIIFGRFALGAIVVEFSNQMCSSVQRGGFYLTGILM